MNALEILMKEVERLNADKQPLSSKLTNTDGMNEYFGEHIVWFDSENDTYKITPVQDTDAVTEIKDWYPHWNVFLTGDLQEDMDEIERNTFLQGNRLNRCFEELGLLDEEITKDAFTVISVVIAEDGKHLIEIPKNCNDCIDDCLCQFEYFDSNEEKRNSIIIGALRNEYSLEQAIVWCMELGYWCSNDIVKTTDKIRTRVEQWTD